MDEQERAERVAKGRRQAEWLASRDVAAVAVTFVDTQRDLSGQGRAGLGVDRIAGWGSAPPGVRRVPAGRLDRGHLGGQPEAVTAVAAGPEPVVRCPAQARLGVGAGRPVDPDGTRTPAAAGCLASRLVERLARPGSAPKAAFEIEWVSTGSRRERPGPVRHRAAYGMTGSSRCRLRRRAAAHAVRAGSSALHQSPGVGAATGDSRRAESLRWPREYPVTVHRDRLRGPACAAARGEVDT